MVAGGQKVLVPALRSRVLLNHESVNFEHKTEVARATSHIKTRELSHRLPTVVFFVFVEA